MNVTEKLIAGSVRDDETGCLRWTGRHDAKDYGEISVSGRSRRVHRVAHEVWIGPIPAGKEIDHVYANGCRYRDCIEPAHLEAVTHKENLLRKTSRITHCPHGHEYTDENTITERGRRKCRECWNSQRACPDCGELVGHRNLARHRARRHGPRRLEEAA